MKKLMLLVGICMIMFLFHSCSSSDSENSVTTNNDSALVGKWIRKNKYHIDFYSNGIGSKDKDVVVTEDIKGKNKLGFIQ